MPRASEAQRAERLNHARDLLLHVDQLSAASNLRSNNRELGKFLEVVSVESINALNVIGLHRCHNLQIKHVATGDGASLQ
jgi:hypothetical protein